VDVKATVDSVKALPQPRAAAPIMFGSPVPPGELLPWDWAKERLERARNYWIATTRRDGSPHCRPVWGVWLTDGFWFSTGSLARANLARNSEITVHLEDGDQVVIVEGNAATESDPASLQAMCDAYGPKYDYPIAVVDGEVRDSSGLGGPAYRTVPRRVFGWDQNMANPTRWSFEL
jgi:hypothetical protein